MAVLVHFPPLFAAPDTSLAFGALRGMVAGDSVRVRRGARCEGLALLELAALRDDCGDSGIALGGRRLGRVLRSKASGTSAPAQVHLPAPSNGGNSSKEQDTPCGRAHLRMTRGAPLAEGSTRERWRAPDIERLASKGAVILKRTRTSAPAWAHPHERLREVLRRV